MKQRVRYGWACVALFLLLSLACNSFPPATGSGGTPTTEVGLVTPEATTPPPTNETQPPATTPPPPTATTAPVPGAGGCTLDAAYVADVTIPDNTELAPGTAFAKTWRLRNSGSCEWKAGTQFVYVSGEMMGASASVAVAATTPNTPVDITVNMVAPTTPNTYKSNWQLQAPDGTRYGGIYYVQIVVPAPIAPPANFAGSMAADCSKATFTWTDAKGEASYRIEGPGLNQTLTADTTSFTWAPPAMGNSTVNLIALKTDGSEIGRVSASVSAGCAPTAPDLIVESVTFNKTPVAHLPVHVTVRIKNQGAATTSAFLLRWWGGKNFTTPSCEWNIPGGLAAGASLNQECDFIYASPYGSIPSKAEVDNNNSIAEASEANNALEVPTAVNNPTVVYDFVAKAPLASWQAGTPAVNLTWPGTDTDNTGFARWVTSGNLETGGGIQDKCLEMHPRWVDNGWIQGAYIDLYSSGYTVQAGDRFQATVGLLQNAGNGNVTFKVMLRAATSGNVWIAQVADGYGDGFKNIDVDLTPYAGQKADVILQVDAGASSSQDWACWITANIIR